MRQLLDRIGLVLGRQVRVPLDHPQRAPAAQLLDRAERHARHGQTAREGVPEHVRPDAAEPGSLAGEPECVTPEWLESVLGEDGV